MYDISLLSLTEASVTLHCEVIASYDFNLCLADKQFATKERRHITVVLLYIEIFHYYYKEMLSVVLCEKLSLHRMQWACTWIVFYLTDRMFSILKIERLFDLYPWDSICVQCSIFRIELILPLG